MLIKTNNFNILLVPSFKQQADVYKTKWPFFINDSLKILGYLCYQFKYPSDGTYHCIVPIQVSF